MVMDQHSSTKEVTSKEVRIAVLVAEQRLLALMILHIVIMLRSVAYESVKSL